MTTRLAELADAFTRAARTASRVGKRAGEADTIDAVRAMYATHQARHAHGVARGG